MKNNKKINMKLASISGLRALLTEPTDSTAVQAFRALFVGGAAFVADAGCLWLISLTGLHYLICAAFGFIAGVAVNFLLSVKFVFPERADMSRGGEIAVYIAVSLVGLGITEALMWLFTDVIGLYFMLSKCAAALIAYGWNFTSRKLILYRNRG